MHSANFAKTAQNNIVQRWTALKLQYIAIATFSSFYYIIIIIIIIIITDWLID